MKGGNTKENKKRTKKEEEKKQKWKNNYRNEKIDWSAKKHITVGWNEKQNKKENGKIN